MFFFGGDPPGLVERFSPVTLVDGCGGWSSRRSVVHGRQFGIGVDARDEERKSDQRSDRRHEYILY